jgi:hypothetical protein
MSTRCFCDLCERPAPAARKSISLEREFGLEHPMLLNSGIKPGRTRVVLRVDLSQRLHETGFSGAPDLCDRCLRSLLDDLAASVTITESAGELAERYLPSQPKP